MNQQKVFIVDFDDTLCATKACRRPLLLRLLHELGAENIEQMPESLWAAPFRQLVESVEPNVHWENVLHRFINLMDENPPIVLPGAREFLEYLRAECIWTVVVSSSLNVLVRADLRASKIDTLVDEVWGSDETRFVKPDLRVMSRVVASLRRRHENFKVCGCIGDSVSDGIVAREWDWRFWGLLTGDTTRQEFLRAGFESRQVLSNLTRFKRLSTFYL